MRRAAAHRPLVSLVGRAPLHPEFVEGGLEVHESRVHGVHDPMHLREQLASGLTRARTARRAAPRRKVHRVVRGGGMSCVRLRYCARHGVLQNRLLHLEAGPRMRGPGPSATGHGDAGPATQVLGGG